ncbi:hypothetical protein GobsT_45730 [Gemmata obscuriglobus]|uniref:hypothetical protein n=1 Tax=Gemmata obscuriglobus TaxID=114 RepID=UPI00016C56D0|nr:hypothetical protein [Gemmata obscuriglobus]QEG29775.1 hypothetical protein GobsT_45730 [Gemmata obscuriglobus]VTS09092.1 unnamed protein product [Gemmata obscuriglobus UQM 2246]
MTRCGSLLLIAALSAAGGCASSAKYVERRGGSGVVAVPDDSDSWPNYNRRAALKLIEQDAGPNYEIIDQRTVKTGRQTRSSLPDTNETLNPRRPGSPGYQSSTHATSMPEATEFRITYRRKDGAAVGDAGAGAPGVVPAGGAAQPRPQPAGAVPGAMSSPFNRPTVTPAGGAACDT